MQATSKVRVLVGLAIGSIFRQILMSNSIGNIIIEVEYYASENTEKKGACQSLTKHNLFQAYIRKAG